MSERRAKITLIISTIIFGTIGVFRRNILMSSEMIALSRAVLGAISMFVIAKLTGERISWKIIRKNIKMLSIMGIALGFDWVLMLESYNHTSVSSATLSYYMAPIFIIVASPFFLGEKLDRKKIIAVMVSLLGMVLISGILTGASGNFKGIVIALAAAVFYAIVIILNKKVTSVNAYEKTLVQFMALAVVMLPYIGLIQGFNIKLDEKSALLILILGIVHTAIGYAIYFKSMEYLKAQTVALFSYIDPVVAILCSFFILKEKMGPVEIIGAVLILSATMLSEVDIKKLKKTR